MYQHSHSNTSDFWVKVLHPTRHKIGHFRDVPQANLLAWYGKTKPNTTKAHIQRSKEMRYNTKTKSKFSRLLWHMAWKREGQFLFWCFINMSLNYLQLFANSAARAIINDDKTATCNLPDQLQCSTATVYYQPQCFMWILQYLQHVFTNHLRPTQPPTLNGTGNDYRPKGSG